MKKIIAIVLLLALVLVGCGEGTGYGDHFDHQTPTEMAEYDKILLERADYAEHIESILNIQAYPDLLISDFEIIYHERLRPGIEGGFFEVSYVIPSESQPEKTREVETIVRLMND